MNGASWNIRHIIRRVGLTLYFSFFFILGFHLGSCVQPQRSTAEPAASEAAMERYEQVEETEELFDGRSPLIDENRPAEAPASRAPGRSVPFVPRITEEDSAELVG